MPGPSSAAPPTLANYVASFAPLIGDQRTARTFQAIVAGVIAAGSLACAAIAAKSPPLATLKDGAQRVIRFATGESTHRSHLDAPHLVAQLAQRGVQHLAATPSTTDLWLIMDGSDLRKPHSHALPYLQQVRDLAGRLVPGYQTINVLAVTPKCRALLYHRLFSSQQPGYQSEPQEVQTALAATHHVLGPLAAQRAVTWIMDRRYDDEAVWRTIWEQAAHLVCRISHVERLVEYQTRAGEWTCGQVSEACAQLWPVGQATSVMEIRLRGQKRAKRQPVTVQFRACPLRLSYESNVRRLGAGEVRQQALWLVEMKVPDSFLEPLLVVTDWPVETEAQAKRIWVMYRQRWAVEDSLKFVKDCLGWEDVQVLDMQGIRTLAALGWVAAGYLYEIKGNWGWEDVEFLAQLGGWERHKDRQPGKEVLLRGLQSLLNYLVTRAQLRQRHAEEGQLPPNVSALLGPEVLAEL
jgi:Transposase DDE domain